MGHMPDINKRQVCTRVPLAIARRVDKVAAKTGRNIAQTIIALLDYATHDVPLDEDDMAAIAAEARLNKTRRDKRKHQ